MNIFKKGRRGFTLIELLVVIAIIGILASIVLVSLNDARRGARDTKKIGDMRQAQLGLEIYFTANSKYPDPATASSCNGANWDAAFGAGGADIAQLVSANTASPQPYRYGADAATNVKDYTIESTLEGTNQILNTDATAENSCTCVDAVFDYCISP